ncbi:MAG TPA: sugar phosphate nucleotidyltransferase [Bryobacteraceae bacterium]|nr:sugar phosphate nucleotidyltransferase [Bryobacteraceae bacterium]
MSVRAEKPEGKRTGSAFQRAYAVIMAGGSGTRFWPLSRRKHPKQLLALFGKTTLLEQTVARLRGAIPPKRTYIFTSEWARDQIVRLLPRIPIDQIIAEPASRNTAPTLGLAAHEILRRDSEALMVALPADHVIRKPDAFRGALLAACEWASTEGRSVILGIKPTRPDTGYGYVRLGREAGRAAGEPIYRVEKFEEKPELAAAQRYLASGDFCWNAGMFVWRAATLLRNLDRFQPEMAGQLEEIRAGGGVRGYTQFRRIFPKLQNISIDYALMQRIPDVFGVATDIGWSDVGSWGVVYGLNQKDQQGNVQPKETIAVQSSGNMIVSPRKLVVTVGVQNLVIVETRDALLVCDREQSQDVGKAVQELERQGKRKLL